jgi:hypothetical protein
MMKNTRQPPHKTDECEDGEEEYEGSFGHPFFLFGTSVKSKINYIPNRQTNKLIINRRI